MWMLILYVCALLLCISVAWYWRELCYRHPPGPFNLPFVGCILSADVKNFQRAHYNNAKKYGRVVRTVMGPYSVVQLNDPGLIKEAFSREELVPRPHFWFIEQRSIINDGATGVVFAKGEMWKEHRRFVIQTLRDLGMSNEKMDDKIIAEAADLIRVIESTDGQPIDTRSTLSSAVANVIGSVLMGTRYHTDDEEMRKIIRYTRESTEFTFENVALAMFPALRYLPGPGMKFYADFTKRLRGFREFFKGPCDIHEKNWQPNRNADFLDTYISAVKNGQYSTLNIKELPLLLEDLFEAGFWTTTTTLRWAFLIMATHPDIQRKIQNELDLNVRNGSFVKYSERVQLPYVEATIKEVHRYASVVPMGIYHCAEKDTIIDGYDIPKGTWIGPNIYYVHHNDEWWDEPEKFSPDRFLTAVNRTANLIPFALGKRQCPGEKLAERELFIIFTAVMHRFTITLPHGVQSTGLLKPTPGIVADTQPHKLCFQPRNATSFLNNDPHASVDL